MASGHLREDLFYRIGRPEIAIPPLRERLEEIPWLIQGELRKLAGAPRVHTSFVEACLLRTWPGNIRELLVEVRAAAQEALAEASPRLEARHLCATAGQAMSRPAPAPPSAVAEPGAPPAAASPVESPDPPPRSSSAASAAGAHSPRAYSMDRAEVEAVLVRTGGNVSRAASALGVQRTTLRRFMERHQIDPARLPGIITRPRKRTDPQTP